MMQGMHEQDRGREIAHADDFDEGMLQQVMQPESKVLSEAYEVYCENLRNGTPIDLDEFCTRFPEAGPSLFQLLKVHQFLGQNSYLVQEKQPAQDESLAWPKAGETLGSYKVARELGRGTMARVFLATEPNLGDRPVVLKVAPSGSSEAKILGPIQHPNIVAVYTIEEHASRGLTAVCMPYAGSATLGTVLARVAKLGGPPECADVILDVIRDVEKSAPHAKRTPAPIIQPRSRYIDGVRRIATQIADALVHLHELGISHLDLKPANVLLSPNAAPMLLDFNLANKPNATAQWIGGTPEYMAPERLQAIVEKRDPRAFDPHSDIFSLGVMLYELSTGRMPFGSLAPRGEMRKMAPERLEHYQQPLVPVRDLNPRVDRAFAHLIESCLEIDPDRRPQTAVAVMEALRRQQAPLPRLGRLLGRHRTLVAAGVVALALAAFLGIAAWIAQAPYSDRQFYAGQAAYEQGRYKDAVVHFGETIKTDPKADAFYRRGRALMKIESQDGWRLALADFEDADKKQPSGKVKACIAYCSTRIGEDVSQHAAIHLYQQAIDAGYATPEVWNNLAFSNMALGEWKEAEQALDRALQLDSRLQVALYNRALAHRHSALAEVSVYEHNLERGMAPTTATNQELKKRATANIQAGVTRIEKAIKVGPVSAELLYDAARMRAVGARLDPDMAAGMLAHLQDAIENHHLDPARLKQEILFEPFRENRAFKAMTERRYSSDEPPPIKAVRVVDPVRQPD